MARQEKTLSISLPPEADQLLSEEAASQGKPRSELARDAIEMFLHERQRARSNAILHQAAADEDAESALDIAEQALPCDNEALEQSESEDWPAKWWR